MIKEGHGFALCVSKKGGLQTNHMLCSLEKNHGTRVTTNFICRHPIKARPSSSYLNLPFWIRSSRFSIRHTAFLPLDRTQSIH